MAFKKCSVSGCPSTVIARGLCDLHYRRQLHHGHLEQTRPTDWGSREKHPLYGVWVTMRRSWKSPVDEQWRDFWKFVVDVGKPPSKKHILFRLDETQPYGPNNFFWREKVCLKRKTESEKEYARRYAREYRKRRPERARNHDLKKSFGIGIEQYDAMLVAQSGVCAICKLPENSIDHRTGGSRRLSVDHHHGTKKVRALLCRGCNQGIGNFREDVKLLRAAIEYLTGAHNEQAKT